MGRRTSQSSRKPQVFKKNKEPETTINGKPIPPQGNTMAGSIGTGMGLGLGVGLGSSVFSTMAGALSSDNDNNNQSQTQESTPSPCDLITKQFQECLKRDLDFKACHDLNSLLIKMNCTQKF